MPEKRRTMSGTNVTWDHDEIRQWAEERGAHPARVRGTGRRGDVGMIRLDFPGFSGARSLEPIEWDEWFESFDENNLALVYRDTTAAGARSNFNKLVGRENVEADMRGERTSRRHPAAARERGTRGAGRTTGRQTPATSGGRTSAHGTRGRRAGASRSRAGGRATGTRATATTRGRRTSAHATGRRGTATSRSGSPGRSGATSRSRSSRRATARSSGRR